MIPNDFLEFDPRTPLHLGTLFSGGGVKTFCVLWPLCVYLDLGPEELYGPPNPWRGSRVPTPGTPRRPPPPPIWALGSEDLAIFTHRLFSSQAKVFLNSILHETLPLTLGWVWVIIW